MCTNNLSSVILEDRRIRINAWVAKITGKPLKKFVNPKLLETEIPEEERKDPRSVNFVISRTEPLSYSIKPKNINEVISHIIYSINGSYRLPQGSKRQLLTRKKLRPNEEKIVLFKLLHRNAHHYCQY